MADEAQSETIALRGGAAMPLLGLGTWQLTGDEARDGARHALEIGYRLIDTADDYRNQAELGEAIRDSGVAREEIFLTSKVEEDEDAHAATGQRLRDLGQDYLDLCLLHRPPPGGAGEALWEGLLEARRDGLAREVGVSNYTAAQLDRLIEATGEAPAVNQVEWSPFGHSAALLDHARAHGVVIQAYSPLTRAKRLDDPVVAEIAEVREGTPAQVLLSWAIELGTPPVPKAASAAHREENLGALELELGAAEVRRLGDLNEGWSALAGLPYV